MTPSRRPAELKVQSPLILPLLSPPRSPHARAPRPAPRPGPAPQPGLAQPAAPLRHGPASPGAASWRHADTRSGPVAPSALSCSRRPRLPVGRSGASCTGRAQPRSLGPARDSPGTACPAGPPLTAFPAAPRHTPQRLRNLSRTAPRPHRSPIPGHRRAAPPGGDVARGQSEGPGGGAGAVPCLPEYGGSTVLTVANSHLHGVRISAMLN